MDFNTDLYGPMGPVVHGDGDHRESALVQRTFLETPTADIPALSGSTASLESSADVRESSLIEEAWISDRGNHECDQYLEHRLMAQEYEGLRMGRELHDSTGQLLLSLRLSVAHLRSSCEVGGSDEILDQINETVRQIDHEIRAFSYLHYPAELGKGGLIAALATLARGFSDRTGLKIVFKSICNRAIANGADSIALLRVAQEGLMNVHRHAHAGLVRLSLVDHHGTLELSVQDDGQGMPPTPSASEPISKGLGLVGMRHRVERLGGNFAIRRLKHGTKLVASLAIGRGRPERLK
jgi:signal transduction histidine kinase